ncbi:hypothetical protein [Candidimonas nitroreducens]|uniref:Uncharacterized protein n=1 Tax=Candidimonas nitroreducens TaxID=683354 RepID=A0A225MMW4_9BURK|nr:hypothetical protein [Candidimonas nitroreducens]OWT61703.1 hypothetical protein CEY11_07590 [Candidimonas nitroreducens]
MRYVKFTVGVALGCLVGWLLGARPGFLAKIDWLNAMTAFGTVGSVMLALWLALSDGRERAQWRAREAVIVRWMISAEIGNIAATVDDLKAELLKIRGMSVGDRIDPLTMGRLRWSVGELKIPASHLVLDKVDVLNQSEGQAIAELVGKVPYLQRNLRRFCTVVAPISELTMQQVDAYLCSVAALHDSLVSSGLMPKPPKEAVAPA